MNTNDRRVSWRLTIAAALATVIVVLGIGLWVSGPDDLKAPWFAPLAGGLSIVSIVAIVFAVRIAR